MIGKEQLPVQRNSGRDRPSALRPAGPRACPTGGGRCSCPEIKLSSAIFRNNLSVTDGISCPGVSGTQHLLLLYLALRDRQREPIEGADSVNMTRVLKNTLCVETVLQGQDFLWLRLLLQIVFSLISLRCLELAY